MKECKMWDGSHEAKHRSRKCNSTTNATSVATTITMLKSVLNLYQAHALSEEKQDISLGYASHALNEVLLHDMPNQRHRGGRISTREAIASFDQQCQ